MFKSKEQLIRGVVLKIFRYAVAHHLNAQQVVLELYLQVFLYTISTLLPVVPHLLIGIKAHAVALSKVRKEIRVVLRYLECK